MTRVGLQMIGLAGPDGAGKTTAVGALASTLRDGRVSVVSVYAYGCVVCRRMLNTASSRGAGPPRRAHAESFSPQWRRVPERRGQPLLAYGHPLVDAAELTLRLAVANVWARLKGTFNGAHSQVVVISDRSPLDALAKHDPPSRSAAAHWYLWLGRRYRAIVFLDAPCEVLAARDGEHDAANLEACRERFARWAVELPNVMRVDVVRSSPVAVSLALLGPGATGGLRDDNSPFRCHRHPTRAGGG